MDFSTICGNPRSNQFPGKLRNSSCCRSGVGAENPQTPLHFIQGEKSVLLVLPSSISPPELGTFPRGISSVRAHNLALYYNVAWITLGVVWLVGAFVTKPVERIQTRSSRFTHTLVFVVAALLMVRAPLHFGALSRRFVPRSLIVGYTGLALTIAGLAFAIWARFYLGRNWSARVTIKKDHELVRTGPYAIVRHPIYSGFIFALAGTVLGFGEIRALLGFVVAIVGIVLKSRLEEEFMSEQFGEEYSRYRQNVKSLIPFVW